MLGTIALGICSGLTAGVTRDLVKWQIKRKRAGSQNPTINIYVDKHRVETPELFDNDGWEAFIAHLDELEQTGYTNNVE